MNIDQMERYLFNLVKAAVDVMSPWDLTMHFDYYGSVVKFITQNCLAPVGDTSQQIMDEVYPKSDWKTKILILQEMKRKIVSLGLTDTSIYEIDTCLTAEYKPKSLGAPAQFIRGITNNRKELVLGERDDVATPGTPFPTDTEKAHMAIWTTICTFSAELRTLLKQPDVTEINIGENKYTVADYIIGNIQPEAKTTVFSANILITLLENVINTVQNQQDAQPVQTGVLYKKRKRSRRYRSALLTQRCAACQRRIP
jgi:hypothetical protein